MPQHCSLGGSRLIIVVITLAMLAGLASAMIPCPFDIPTPEGAPLPPAITAGFECVGVIQSGSYTVDVDITHETVGNLTTTTLYSSDLMGRGTGQFASSAGYGGTTVTGEQAASLTSGRVSGQSTGYLHQATTEPGRCREPEDQTDQVMPLCEKARSSARYDISMGTAAVNTIVTVPAPSAGLNQQIVVDGNGGAAIRSSYLTRAGFDSDQSNRFSGEAMIDGKGVQFAGKYGFASA